MPTSWLNVLRRNLCGRMHADLPVALSIQENSLAAQHRRLFLSKLGTYDYYLSHGALQDSFKGLGSAPGNSSQRLQCQEAPAKRRLLTAALPVP